MRPADYAGLGPLSVWGARVAGVWDRLGPVTRPVFERFPQARAPAALAAPTLRPTR